MAEHLEGRGAGSSDLVARLSGLENRIVCLGHEHAARAARVAELGALGWELLKRALRAEREVRQLQTDLLMMRRGAL